MDLTATNPNGIRAGGTHRRPKEESMKARVLALSSAAAAMWLCHDVLKLESAFARRVRESFHFSVIKKTAAIEDDFVDFL